jgi:hypothetical protein
MPVKVYSSSEHIQNMNGVNVKHQKYELAVNPNNNNLIHVSLTNNGLTFKKEYDSLENFFNEINNNSKEGLITNMQKDLKKFESMPVVLYRENTTQKRKKSKKPKRTSSQKKLKKPKSAKK